MDYQRLSHAHLAPRSLSALLRKHYKLQGSGVFRHTLIADPLLQIHAGTLLAENNVERKLYLGHACVIRECRNQMLSSDLGRLPRETSPSGDFAFTEKRISYLRFVVVRMLQDSCSDKRKTGACDSNEKCGHVK
jgi:hypothetical protein